MVFDTLGQMWGTLLVNGMTLVCSLICIAGVCIKEKLTLILVRLRYAWRMLNCPLRIVDAWMCFGTCDVHMIAFEQSACAIIFKQLMVLSTNMWGYGGFLHR